MSRLVLLLLLLPIGALAVLGLFSRYAADDYCTAGQVVTAGFWEAQTRLYLGWSGRFAATLSITLAELVGPSIVPVLPLLALTAWLTAATWAVRALAFSVLGRRVRLIDAAIVAAAVIFATLQATADLPQIVFWQTGTLTYLAPLIAATALTALICRSTTHLPQPAIAIGVSLGLAFFAGGTSETYAAAQVVALVCALSIAVLTRAPRLVQRSLIAALAGGVLALAIVAVSPGNEVREASAERLPLSEALPQAIAFTLTWLRLTFARPHAAALGVLIACSLWLGAAYQSSRGVRPGMVAALLASTACVLVACMLPAAYALGADPPGRAQLLPEYVLMVVVAVAAWCAGMALGRFAQRGAGVPARITLRAALLLLLLIGPVAMAAVLVRDLSSARAYAVTWDTLDAQLRASGGQNVVIPPLAQTGVVRNLDFVGPDREDWFNSCVARYYRLASIATR